MLTLAVANVDRLNVDTREAERDEPTYTVDTLTQVRAENPDATLLFFMGMDAFSDFDQWHRWEDILTIANLIVVDRPGATLSDFSMDLIRRQSKRMGASIKDGSSGVIERCEVTQLSISATSVREQVGSGGNIQFLLPDPVREYILEHGLYR